MLLDFINYYKFGSISIENNTYTKDIILLKRDIKPEWWRKQGHNLAKEDLTDIIDFDPELVIIGTGFYGMMKVPPNLPNQLNFKMIILPTQDAVKTYNHELTENKKIAGAFHLTC